MKIATLTFHRALNYGAVLQTYALQKVLDDLGYDTEVLDYRSSFIEKHYEPDKIRDYLSPKKMAILLLLNGFSIVKRSQFQHFLDNQIRLSKPCYSQSDLEEIESNYDMILVGSDQIWNYKTAGFDKAYFLNFVKDNSKKASYAASIGLSVIPEEFIASYQKLLESFSKISVRECEGQQLLETLLQRQDIRTVVDPTLLIKKDHWSELGVECEVPDRYVLVYLLSENRKIVNFAKKVAKQKKCKIVYINTQLFRQSGMVNKRNISPENWIYLFENAEYIVTNSFHGTVFSIIFRKVFWSDYLPTSGNVNSRITTLLGGLQLKDRIISEGCSSKDDKINYDYTEKKISNLINDGLRFLKSLGE